jgi:hypothetical protein
MLLCIWAAARGGGGHICIVDDVVMMPLYGLQSCVWGIRCVGC